MIWLLLAALGMIWAAFLLPVRRRSPITTVEEFEQKMSLLAEANRATLGRYVLMPRKGERFLGPEDRRRVRVRRRRRRLFVALLDAAALTLVMGMFPPFRVMLIGTGIMATVLLAYSALLVQLRLEEAARRRRAPARAYSRFVPVVQGRGNGGNGPRRPGSDGNGGLHGHVDLVDLEDVHVVVHRSDEIDLEEVAAAGRRG